MTVKELIEQADYILRDMPEGIITDEEGGRPFKMRVRIKYENGKYQLLSGICLATIFENMHHNNAGHDCYNVPIAEWKCFTFNGLKDYEEKAKRIDIKEWIKECKEHGFIKYADINKNRFGVSMTWNKEKLPNISVAEWYAELQMMRWCREWDSIPYLTMKMHKIGVDFLQSLIAATIWNTCRFCHNFIYGTGEYDVSAGIARAIQSGIIIHNVMNNNMKDERSLWNTYTNNYHYYQVFYNAFNYNKELYGIKSNKDPYKYKTDMKKELMAFAMHPMFKDIIHNDNFIEGQKQLLVFSEIFQEKIDNYYKVIA